MNLIEFLRAAEIEDLDLPGQINQKLQDQNLTDFQKLYSSIQAYRTFGKCTLKGFTEAEIQIINQQVTDLMVTNGLVKQKKQSTSPATVRASSPPTVTRNSHSATPTTARPTAPITYPVLVEKQPNNENTKQPAKRSALAAAPSPTDQCFLTIQENRLAPQLRKVELVGEIPLTQEELKDLSQHFSHLFNNHSEQTVLEFIEQNYPATFLVYMVGQGIYGYNGGNFWPAYEQALRKDIDHSALGKLFEKLLQHYNKPSFRELQERSMRYVSLILAHGGIPVYCLNDYFSNIVLNCATHPQLFSLEGEELIEEVLKHSTFTTNTDKPVVYFLEYGGKTAANLLDRSRKMLLNWQQNQTLLSSEEAGLPAHVTRHFAEWTRENTTITMGREPRNRLKRPRLSLDPWGLGVFLFLPSQPVSALGMSALYWKIDAGEYQEEIKACTQRKGDRVETREITLRLNEISEVIQTQFSQEDNLFDWKISGYSPDHLILAFDPNTGYVQNHILAQETWLVYPSQFSLSILEGEGDLIEVLPELPGKWSKFKLGCWDLSQTVRLGLIQDDKVFREIIVRSQEKLPPPSFVGSRIVPTDLEENPIPVYIGSPPSLHIPLSRSDDLRVELSRWKIRVDNIGVADPNVSIETTLADLPKTVCTILENIAIIRLETPELLTARPTGTYQIAIKGPLGRDAALSLQILPECEVSGLKELYIPDRNHGPENVSFSIQTSLLDGLDSLNGADGIKIDIKKSGLHNIMVPAELSSVGLLIRRKTVDHLFIRVPLYFRINRLRWRLVGDKGQMENWLQKHISRSLQELLQEESPLLIVDLPGNEGKDGTDPDGLSLQLNLLDIHGNIIQQLKPSDRSAKRTNRFWRFDLSKIKHSMEMNDSPIFRVDLVGIKDAKGKEEFSLPVLVFTRKIQIEQFSTEIYTSSEQHHVLVTWQEKKQLQSRALILWSLFRPWQAPIVETIPDSACGEYEFSFTRKEHAEGIYRLQMVVVDPWAPSPPPPLPPASSLADCCDMELSSPAERLKELEGEIIAVNKRQTNQFSNCIEISLIRQYLGETQASYRDLEMCCHNLIPATSREILTLRSILEQINSTNLEKGFGSQIIQPEVLNRLVEDMTVGIITLSELTSILKLAPHSNNWTAETCEILVQLEDPKTRFRALVQLIVKDTKKAVASILKLLHQSSLSLEDAVELLYEEKPIASKQLKNEKDDPIAEQLLDLLGRYNPYSGLPIVRPGSWVLTNAGWGRIAEILDPHTRISVDSFLEGEGKYILSVTLNIYECYDLAGEKALINMSKNQITFPRAHRIYICPHCQEFATATLNIFKSHLTISHGNAIPYPGEQTNIMCLTDIQFNMKPHQNKRDSYNDLSSIH